MSEYESPKGQGRGTGYPKPAPGEFKTDKNGIGGGRVALTPEVRTILGIMDGGVGQQPFVTSCDGDEDEQET